MPAPEMSSKRRRNRVADNSGSAPASATAPATGQSITSQPEPKPRDGFSPLARDRQLIAVVGIILLLGAFLFGALWKLTPTRSFHADELTNLRIHVYREGGKRVEEQHRLFHEFYAWWLTDRLGERYARIPSMVFVTLGLLSFAALAGRIGGRWAALWAALLILFWPRTWDDGQEMRYYGFIFLSSTLGLHCLLSICRGWIYWPLASLAFLLYVQIGWHPTGVAWHGTALVSGALLAGWEVWRRTRAWRSLPKPRPFPWLSVGLPILIAVIGLIGVALLAPAILRQSTGMTFDQILGRIGRLRPEGIHLWRWYVAWVGDRFAPYPALHWLLYPIYTALCGMGAVLLWRRHRSLAVIFAGLIVLQLLQALFFRFSWRPIAGNHKYLTSSGAIIALSLALGMAWACRFWAERLPRWRAAAPVLVLVLFLIPMLPRTLVSATGDASHFRQVWTSIMARSEGRGVPIALAVGEMIQSARTYRYLMPRFLLQEYPAEDIMQSRALTGLIARRNPVFVVCHPFQVRRVVRNGHFQVLERFQSNFTEDWNFVLMGVPSGHRLAAGSWAQLSESDEVYFLEPSLWTVDGGSVQIGAQLLTEGSVLAVDAHTTATITNLVGMPRLIPTLQEGPIRRQGGLASDGPFDSANMPRVRDNELHYHVSNVDQVDYDLFIPRDANRLIIEVTRDLPRLGSFTVQINRELIGLYIDVPLPEKDPGAGSTWNVIIPIRPQHRGVPATVTIGNHGENSIRKADTDEVRVLKIRALRLETQNERSPITPNHLEINPLTPAPPWASGGVVDFRRPESVQLLSIAGSTEGSWEKPEFRFHPERGTSIHLPERMPSQIVSLPAMAVTPGELLCIEIEARGRNMILKNAAPMVGYYRADGSMIRSGQLSQKYITSSDPDWTRRTFLEAIPADAVAAVPAFYLNSPSAPGTRLRDDSRIDLREIRFLTYTPLSRVPVPADWPGNVSRRLPGEVDVAGVSPESATREP
jgi:hypothetical protein